VPASEFVFVGIFFEVDTDRIMPEEKLDGAIE
jgi:hypothetical protein